MHTPPASERQSWTRLGFLGLLFKPLYDMVSQSLQPGAALTWRPKTLGPDPKASSPDFSPLSPV